MAWSLLLRGCGDRGRSHRRHRARTSWRSGADDRRHGTRRGAGLHRRALALGPLLLRVSFGGIEDPPGRDDRSRRHVLLLPGAAARGAGGGRARLGGRHRRHAGSPMAVVRAVSRCARVDPSRRQRRPPRRARRDAHRGDGLREPTGAIRRPPVDGAVAR